MVKVSQQDKLRQRLSTYYKAWQRLHRRGASDEEIIYILRKLHGALDTATDDSYASSLAKFYRHLADALEHTNMRGSTLPSPVLSLQDLCFPKLASLSGFRLAARAVELLANNASMLADVESHIEKLRDNTGYPFWNWGLALLLQRWVAARRNQGADVTLVPADQRIQHWPRESGDWYDAWITLDPQGISEAYLWAFRMQVEPDLPVNTRSFSDAVQFRLNQDVQVSIKIENTDDLSRSEHDYLIEAHQALLGASDEEGLVCRQPRSLSAAQPVPFRICFSKQSVEHQDEPRLTSEYLEQGGLSLNFLPGYLLVSAVFRDATGVCETNALAIQLKRA